MIAIVIYTITNLHLGKFLENLFNMCDERTF